MSMLFSAMPLLALLAGEGWRDIDIYSLRRCRHAAIAGMHAVYQHTAIGTASPSALFTASHFVSDAAFYPADYLRDRAFSRF